MDSHAPQLKKEDVRLLGEGAFFIFSVEYVVNGVTFFFILQNCFKSLQKKVIRTIKKRQNTVTTNLTLKTFNVSFGEDADRLEYPIKSLGCLAPSF